MKEIRHVTEEVRLAIEEAKQLNEKFPSNFTKALDLVKIANELKYGSSQKSVGKNVLKTNL